MHKKVAVVTLWSGVAQAHAKQLKKLFGEKINIVTYSFDADRIDRTIEADLILISLYSVYINIKKFITPHSKVVIINPTINELQYAQIMSIPAGEKVMVVNYSSEMTMETIALFNQLDINHVEFFPVYPGLADFPHAEYAVTPGETQYVPEFVRRVIDIGHRVLDTGTLVDMAVKLNMEHLLQEEHFIDHLESLKSHRSGLQALLGRTNTLESEMDSLLNVLDDGIIGVDAGGSVHAFNKRAESITGYEKEEVLGKNIEEILPQIPFGQVLETGEPVKATLVKINDSDVSTTVVPVMVSRKTTGALAIINEFTEQERNQHKLRLQYIGKGHKARYRFEDIAGKSPEMVELKNIAARMARSDSSVLISGESGTGKELFAQAIHNASRRKDFQFVAVNCAALPESLLESELFGYEEGSFTGARKGGKIGLFELAHQGTLFLDEIGEMALNLQARLLRVIQEREVMRIGGDRVIKIDIRIITSTNNDLKKLAEQGKFRKDLYYRLNVLPLRTIPLRNRREDILLLAERIKKELEVDYTLTQDAMRAFESCSWEGNVRELRNCVEFLAHLGKKVIDIGDIPFMGQELHEPRKLKDSEWDLINRLWAEIRPQEKKYMLLLECLENSMRLRHRVGRRSLVALAEERGTFLSENEVRGMLNLLKAYGLISLSNGRGGTQITELGISVLEALSIG